MGFFDYKPKKEGGFFDIFDNKHNNNNSFGSSYKNDEWRKDIPYNDTHDSHIWDWDAPDTDGDGYRDRIVDDSDLWDD